MRLFLDSQQLAAVAARHRDEYARARPFPHVVLDGLFPDEMLDLALAEFPSPGSDVWWRYENYHERKLEAQGEARIGADTSLLLYQFNSAPFLRFLEQLTGIEHLLPDPYFLGGGLHQIEPGGKLGIHADYSRHDRLPLERRINVLIYLNRDWKEEYGGALELWGPHRDRCYERILPLFNRTVIFSITDWAYHGHPDPLTCPEGMTRKSIALYYFTVDRPRGEVTKGKRQTLFIRRPGEVVPAGTKFTRDSAPPWMLRTKATLRPLIPSRLLEWSRSVRRTTAKKRRPR